MLCCLAHLNNCANEMTALSAVAAEREGGGGGGGGGSWRAPFPIISLGGGG